MAKSDSSSSSVARLAVSLIHMILALVFATGIILIYTHDEPSNRDVRNAGMAMVSISAATILLAWGLGSVFRSVKLLRGQ